MAMYYGDENGKAQEVVVVGMQGPAGPQGPQGATGPQGPAGQGVPAGGTAGQVLKQSNDGPVWADDTALGTVVQSTLEFIVYQKGKLITIVANKIFPVTSSTLTDNAGIVNTPYFENKVLTPPPNTKQEYFLTSALSTQGGNLFSIIWSCEVDTFGNIRIVAAYANGKTTVTGTPTIFYNVWPLTILCQYLIE